MSGIVRYTLPRLVQALVVAFAVAAIAFLLVRIAPGDPARAILGEKASADAVAAFRAQLHLNEPMWRQFVDYFRGIAQGDLGRSLIVSQLTVGSIIVKALPVTLSVILLTLVISAVIGIPVGLLAALSKVKYLDVGIRTTVAISLAMPPFLAGLILLLVFSFSLNLLPTGGWPGHWPENFRYIILPSLALACFLGPFVIRTVRQAALDVSEEEFVEAAIVRGLPQRTVVFRHILPNSLLPVVTLLGITFGALISGAVVVEAVFNLPGIGTQLAQAVGSRDYTVVQGIALVTGLIVVGVNLVTDVVYAIVDPRARRT
jgi:peptide/nickel transport system permease protein